MKALLRRYVAGLNGVIGWIAISLLLLMTLLEISIIVLSSGFDIGYVWLQELVLYLHGIIIMTSISYTAYHNKHVRIDIFYERATARYRRAVDFWGTVLLLLPCCAVIFYLSAPYVFDSWRVLEGSQEAGGIPAFFFIKTFILLLPLLLVIQGIFILCNPPATSATVDS